MDELLVELNEQADLMRDGHSMLGDEELADLLGRAAEAIEKLWRMYAAEHAMTLR